MILLVTSVISTSLSSQVMNFLVKRRRVDLEEEASELEESRGEGRVSDEGGYEAQRTTLMRNLRAQGTG